MKSKIQSSNYTTDFSLVLIDWYKVNGRDLPWRSSKDPYIIWISEIILQQTRVKQGYEYFVRFTKRFPDVKSLAEAEEDEVMKYWQGLGYYSRARNLHSAAKSMNGKFPETYEEVRLLKGIGDYTAAAICSAAYDMPYAVVDGNVYRVLSRYFGIDTPIDSTEGKKTFASLAAELLDKFQPAIYNQAIMDFGALQCTPSSPKCMFCPQVDSCIAYSKGLISQLPVKRHKTTTTSRYFNYLFVKAGNNTFIHKREGNDIWRNLYEFPLIESDRPLEKSEFVQLPALTEFFATGEQPIIRLITSNIKHILSHRVIYASFYEIILPENSKSFSSYPKISLDDLEKYPVSQLVHNFMEKYL